MNAEELKTLWLQVFPKSYAMVQVSYLGKETFFFTGFLQTKAEWNNSISQNDPLRYLVRFEKDLTFVECDAASLIQTATSPYMAYSSVHMRKKTIKNATTAKVLKRFEEVKSFILENVDNVPQDFNVKDKI